MKNKLKDKMIEILIDYIIDNPPQSVSENNLIPWELYIGSAIDDKERTRAYMQVLEIVINKAQEELLYETMASKIN